MKYMIMLKGTLLNSHHNIISYHGLLGPLKSFPQLRPELYRILLKGYLQILNTPKSRMIQSRIWR
jgi:hypothetical protein